MRTLELLVSVIGYESKVSSVESGESKYHQLLFEPLAMRVAETSKWCEVSNEIHKGISRVPRSLRVSDKTDEIWFSSTNTNFKNILILTVDEQIYGITKYIKDDIELLHGTKAIENKKANIKDIRFDIQKVRQNLYEHTRISEVCDIPYVVLDKGMENAMKKVSTNLFV